MAIMLLAELCEWVELPGVIYRDLIACAEVLGRTIGQIVPDPAKLIVPMIQHFMATDRAFVKVRRSLKHLADGQPDGAG